jgi:formate hydrogenlyase subunit 4
MIGKLPSLIALVLTLTASPLLLGVINRVKAIFAGRQGQVLLQPYHDLFKLLRKGAAYSRTTTWVFRAGPIISLSAMIVAGAIVPLGGESGMLSFPGDLLLLAYLLGLTRFVTVAAAMDVGSSFEGMGASREVQFSALTEPALLLGLAAMAAHARSLSLEGLYAGVSPATFLTPAGGAMLLVAGAMLLVLLAENSRMPVDDPNTHLELTMIHEVMVLDHGGVDLAFIQYAAAVKLWVLAALLGGILAPVRSPSPWVNLAVGVGGVLAVAVVVGVIESTMARLRLLRVPQLLVAGSILSTLALVLVLR